MHTEKRRLADCIYSFAISFCLSLSCTFSLLFQHVDAINLCARAIEAIGSTTAMEEEEEYSLPPQSMPGSLFPCPTIRIASRFISYLSKQAKETGGNSKRASTTHDASVVSPSPSPAQIVLDAFVYSVHGNGGDGGGDHRDNNTNFDWALILSYFPRVLRTLIELAVQQCHTDANPNWPSYLLILIERNDLCGEFLRYCLASQEACVYLLRMTELSFFI